jgi:uncharacterized iron-regulated membrane protein
MKQINELGSSQGATSSSALYQSVWRWHFYAGIITAPFAIFLAITGAIYLWKPQYEAWKYHELLHVPNESKAYVSADVQFAAARSTHADASFVSYTPPVALGSSSETVLTLKNTDTVSVFVNPYNGQVLGERKESQRLMQKIHDLHGTLLAGKFGQYVVELAATWMFVLLLTGFYLWWPRPKFQVSGFLLPRLKSGRRIFWRDIHAVTAVWSSAGMLFLLTTGMLWTQAGGGWFKDISERLGQGTPRASLTESHQSTLIGWQPPLKAGLAERVDNLKSNTSSTKDAMPSGHHHWKKPSGTSNLAKGAISLDRVISIAEENKVPSSYTILFPNGPTGVFSVVTDRDRPFERTFLHLDQYSGKVLADVRYKDFGLLGKYGMWAIIAHEGNLFGIFNKILGTLAAIGVMLIAVAGLVLWKIRTPASNTLSEYPALPWKIKLGLVLLALFLPLLILSLIVIGIIDKLLLRMFFKRRVYV